MNAFALHASGSELLEESRKCLLKATIENALKTPFYRHLWGHISPQSRDLTLSDLPIVHKSDLVAADSRAQVRDGQITKEKVTGGTSGTPFVHIVGQREQQALKDLYSQIHARHRSRLAPRGIRFHDTHVAFERPIPTPIRFHDLSIYGASTFAYARRVLSERHCEDAVEPECTILAAGDRILRALTDDTKRVHCGRFPNSLKYIFTYSNYLTAVARRDYENTWGLRVTDRYGLSEVAGGATEHPSCGWYHFDEIVIPEVLGHRSLQSIREGIGMLVLTPLFPFQECQPLVRYWTDDVVEVTYTRSSVPGRMAIRPLGRALGGVPALDGDGWLMTPNVLFEILEDRTDIFRTPLFRDSPQVADPFRCGLPLYRLKTSTKSSVARVCLELALDGSPQRRRAILNDLSSLILDRAPTLAKACAAKEIEFDVVRMSPKNARVESSVQAGTQQ
jgi:phenylacetate-coenzyme A ligase PaaK-like adenylate-forming protein